MSYQFMIGIMIVLVIIALFIFVFMINNGQAKKGKVMKKKIIDFDVIQKKNTPVTNLCDVYVEGQKKPVRLSVPKHYELEKGQLMTYKTINKKARFIMLEEVIKESEE